MFVAFIRVKIRTVLRFYLQFSSIQRFIGECFDHWIDAFLAMIVIIEKKNRWLKLQLYVSNRHNEGGNEREDWARWQIQNRYMSYLIWFGLVANSYMRLNNIDFIFQTTYIECSVNGQALKIGWKNEMSISARSWHLIVLTSMEKTVRQRKGSEKKNWRISSFSFLCLFFFIDALKKVSIYTSIGRKWLSTCWHQFRFYWFYSVFGLRNSEAFYFYWHTNTYKCPTKTMNTLHYWLQLDILWRTSIIMVSSELQYSSTSAFLLIHSLCV